MSTPTKPPKKNAPLREQSGHQKRSIEQRNFRGQDSITDSRTAVIANAKDHERAAQKSEWANAVSYETPAWKARLLHSVRKAHKGNSIDVQRQRIMAAFERCGRSLTTVEIRQHLDIQSPASRVMELRRRLDRPIVSSWVIQETMDGITHRFAKYTLTTRKGRSNGA